MKRVLLLFTIISLFLLSAEYSYSQTVYVTKSGKKYHNSSCRYLSNSAIPLSLEDAVSKGYEACLVCKPPVLEDKQFIDGSTDGSSEDTFIEKTTESVQCSAKTKKGTRCKRMTKSSNGKCWQHGG